jgi:hypothetical protein
MSIGIEEPECEDVVTERDFDVMFEKFNVVRICWV